MKTLLTFTGFHDPYSVGLIGDEEQHGPILSLVGARAFDRVVLLSTPTTRDHTTATRDALGTLHPDLDVQILDADLSDPTDYAAILRFLRRVALAALAPSPNEEYFVSVASGTPQMHACWVLLASSGELPARILHVRPPKYVTRTSPMVSEVNLSAPELPELPSFMLCESVCEDSSASPMGLAFSARLPGPSYRARRAGREESARQVGLDAALRELGIVGEHPSYVKALKMAAVVAEHHTPVLIRGETGTGKDLVAKLIHRLSGQDRDTFVAVNCGAISASLVESTLFGHKKGAFTGAVSDQPGKFEQAHGGTLFLDEIGELPPEIQPKLLRVLEDGMVEPLGSKSARRVHVRIIAATHRDLEAGIDSGGFREDLFYRLSVSTIRLPALRDRRSDIPVLALNMLEKLNRSMRHKKRLAQDALARLEEHHWRGNVRDLENVLQRSMMMCTGSLLRADDLLIEEPRRRKDPLSGLPDPHEGFSLDQYLKSVRKQMMLRALAMTRGNQTRAAKLLGLSSQAVQKFVKSQSEA